jgi:hypothetical protein
MLNIKVAHSLVLHGCAYPDRLAAERCALWLADQHGVGLVVVDGQAANLNRLNLNTVLSHHNQPVKMAAAAAAAAAAAL